MIRASSRLRSGTFDCISILPPRCIRKVRSETLCIATPSTSPRRSTIAWAWSVLTRGTGHVDAQLLVSGVGHVEGGDDAPGVLDRVSERWLTALPPAGTSRRTVIE